MPGYHFSGTLFPDPPRKAIPMSGKLPNTFKKFSARFPGLASAHEKMGQAISAAGPLSDREQALVKIGLCVGAGMESALRSHIRRAMEAGVTAGEIEHAIAQAMTTLGFPATVQAWSWAQIQFERDRLEAAGAEAEA